MTDGLRLKLEGIGWLAAWRVSRMLPERWVTAAFERMGERSYRKNARRRAVVEANLEPIVGREVLDATVREAFRWYGRYWAETFRMQDFTAEEVDRRFRMKGKEHLERAHASGKGAVFAVPHLGNWDAAGRWASERWPLTAVVEVLRPRMLFDRFVAHRRSLGMTIVPLEKGTDPTARCLERLRAGEFVALVCDRDLSGRGIEVEMFGRRATMPPGPAVLSLRSGAPIIAAGIYQHDDGTWDCRVYDPIEPEGPESLEAVARTTQRLADVFAALIAEAPAQWHVFAPYWTGR